MQDVLQNNKEIHQELEMKATKGRGKQNGEQTKEVPGFLRTFNCLVHIREGNLRLGAEKLLKLRKTDGLYDIFEL